MAAGGPPSAYSPAFLDHLQNPRNAGRLERPTHQGSAEDPVCGDRLTLDLHVEEGVVREARFRVQGCTAAIAVGSALASLLPGRPLADGAVPAAEVERALGGIPPAKRHALRLAEDTLRAAVRGATG